MLKEILIITNNNTTKEIFKLYFSEEYNISIYKSIDDSIKNNCKSFFDYVFIEISYLKNFETIPLTQEVFNKTFLPLLENFPESKKIVMADRLHTQDCVLAIKLGINNYINYPLVVEEIQYVMDLIYKNIKNEAVIDYLDKKSFQTAPGDLLQSQSPSMQSIIEKIRAVAKTRSTVLLTGGSGTGKSVLARKIHELSNREKNKFISVHCGAIPENLIESELFGHEKGSFTGAIKKKLGKFELADSGTIFLDEIGTLTEATQIRLLQVLQERFIQRVGGVENIPIDIRVIAATNSNLEYRVKKKTFRKDLYYRLNVFQIEVPPLSKRTEDLKELSKSILTRFNHLYRKNINSLDSAVLEAFKLYSWPGNIRELENLIERAYVLEKGNTLSAEHFPNDLFKEVNIPKSILTLTGSLNLHDERKKALRSFEKNYIEVLLQKSNGCLKKASTISGVSVRQLHKFIAKYEINRKEYILNNP